MFSALEAWATDCAYDLFQSGNRAYISGAEASSTKQMQNSEKFQELEDDHIIGEGAYEARAGRASIRDSFLFYASELLRICS